MRILAMSDIHGKVSAVRRILAAESEYDAVLVAGDVSSYIGTRWDEVFNTMLKYVPKNVNVYVVPGNVDPRNMTSSTGRIRVIHNSYVKLGDYFIIGIGGGLGFGFWDIYRLSDEHMRRFVSETLLLVEKSIVNKAVILLTHTPPHDTKVDTLMDGRHVGSKALRWFIEKYKPVLNVCGHIHEGRGIDRINDTYIVNPGAAMMGYYAVIIMEDNRVSKITLNEV